jgi:hypothetical protein
LLLPALQRLLNLAPLAPAEAALVLGISSGALVLAGLLSDAPWPSCPEA